LSTKAFETAGVTAQPRISMRSAAYRAVFRMRPHHSFESDLGFLDISRGSSESPKLVLAWRVRPASESYYPVMYINARTGRILIFDDGVRF
jgi:hypothetical protein